MNNSSLSGSMAEQIHLISDGWRKSQASDIYDKPDLVT